MDVVVSSSAWLSVLVREVRAVVSSSAWGTSVYRERERGYDFSIQFFLRQNHSKRRV